jgi:hypothetical protein
MRRFTLVLGVALRFSPPLPSLNLVTASLTCLPPVRSAPMSPA